MSYNEETDGVKGRTRNGSKMFYELLQEAAETHDKKSHDYASNNNPFGNYHFAGQMALLFSHSPNDAGFMGRLAEKIYRLANLESSGKIAKNESIEDTERDIAVIATLWMASRREERFKNRTAHLNHILNRDEVDTAQQPESIGTRTITYMSGNNKSQKQIDEELETFAIENGHYLSVNGLDRIISYLQACKVSRGLRP